MPTRGFRALLAGASMALALGACVPRTAPPAAIPPPAPLPPPAPPPVPSPPPGVDWATGPLSPGDWAYRPSPDTPLAAFGSERIAVAVRCEQRRAVGIAITGAQGDSLTIRTSFGARRLPAERAGSNEMVVRLPPSDPLLDQLAFSRGRFQIAVDGGPSLVVPAWPEIGRVIEDCRGQ